MQALSANALQSFPAHWRMNKRAWNGILEGCLHGLIIIMAAIRAGFLSCRHVFSVGVSNYGVADCELLAQDTHKFESRYLDSLIGYAANILWRHTYNRAQPHKDSPDRLRVILIKCQT